MPPLQTTPEPPAQPTTPALPTVVSRGLRVERPTRIGRGVMASLAVHLVVLATAFVVVPLLFPEHFEDKPSTVAIDLHLDTPELVEEIQLPDPEPPEVQRVEEDYVERQPEYVPPEFHEPDPFEAPPDCIDSAARASELAVVVGKRRRTAPTPPPVAEAPPTPVAPSPPVVTEPVPEPTPVAVGPTRKARAAKALPRPKYPTIARRRGWEGTVLLELTIDASGAVTDVTVKESSGRNALDRAAVSRAETWQFEPALRNGEAIVDTLEVPVTFALR